MTSFQAFIHRPAILFATICILAIAIASTAKASVIQVDFQSTVTYVQQLPIFGISPSLGDSVVGHFTYDTNAVDQDPGDPTHGSYNSGSIEIQIGGLTLSSEFAPRQETYDINGPNDIWLTVAGTGAGQTGILVNGVSTPDAQILLSFTQPAGLLTSDAQPSLSDFALLNVSQFHIVQDIAGTAIDSVVIFDNVTSTSVSAVPSPAIVPSVLAGLAVLGITARRKRRLPS